MPMHNFSNDGSWISIGYPPNITLLRIFENYRDYLMYFLVFSLFLVLPTENYV